MPYFFVQGPTQTASDRLRRSLAAILRSQHRARQRRRPARKGPQTGPNLYSSPLTNNSFFFGTHLYLVPIELEHFWSKTGSSLFTVHYQLEQDQKIKHEALLISWNGTGAATTRRLERGGFAAAAQRSRPAAAAGRGAHAQPGAGALARREEALDRRARRPEPDTVGRRERPAAAAATPPPPPPTAASAAGLQPWNTRNTWNARIAHGASFTSHARKGEHWLLIAFARGSLTAVLFCVAALSHETRRCRHHMQLLWTCYL